MNRDTRDKLTSGTGPDLTAGNACWETAPAIFADIAARFGPFDVDLTADAGRALCCRFFGPGSALCADALIAPWHAYGRNGYSNPPYGPFIGRILPKAIAEAAEGTLTRTRVARAGACEPVGRGSRGGAPRGRGY